MQFLESIQEPIQAEQLKQAEVSAIALTGLFFSNKPTMNRLDNDLLA